MYSQNQITIRGKFGQTVVQSQQQRLQQRAVLRLDRAYLPLKISQILKKGRTVYCEISVCTHINPISDVKSSGQSLFALICTLAVWLHLKCGLSRAATNQVLRILELLVIVTIDFYRLVIQSKHLPIADLPTSSQSLPQLPHDVRTAMTALALEP